MLADEWIKPEKIPSHSPFHPSLSVMAPTFKYQHREEKKHQLRRLTIKSQAQHVNGHGGRPCLENNNRQKHIQIKGYSRHSTDYLVWAETVSMMCPMLLALYYNKLW